MSRLTDLQAELTAIKTAITAVQTAGQSYTIASGNGGSSRTVTQADLKTLYAEKKEIESQIAMIQGYGGSRMVPGW